MPASAYELTLDGQAADAALYDAVRTLEVTERADSPSQLRLLLGVTRDPTGRWGHAEDDTFPLFATVGVSIGFTRTGGPSPVSAQLEPVLRAYVTSVALRVGPEPEDAVLEVTGTDDSVLLGLEDKVRAWPNASDSDIATRIIGEYQCTPDVETTAPTRQDNDTLVLQRTNDDEFLRALAQRNGYELTFTSGAGGTVTCRFGPPPLTAQPQPDLALRFGEDSNLVSFEVALDGARPLAVSARQLDAKTRSDTTANASVTALPLLGDQALDAVEGGRLGTLVTPLSSNGELQLLPHPSADTTELQTAVQAARDRSAWFASARGEVNSEAYGHVLRAGRTVLVKGAGTLHSGRYYVTQVSHRIEAGGTYTQAFEAKRNARGLDGGERFASPTARAVPSAPPAS